MIYKRQIKPTTQKDVDRFWSHVDIREPNECWNWKLSPTPNGYGLYASGGKIYRTQRFAYLHSNGLNTHKLTKHEKITTTCGNNLCCNPAHLKYNKMQDVWNKIKEDGTMTCGSKHAMSKMTEQDVRDIRARYVSRSNVDGYAGIGKDYGVTPGCIRDIMIGKTWKHVV